MRTIFTAELTQLGDDLVTMSQLVETAVSTAGTALLTADLTLAESVIAADAKIDALEGQIDERCIQILVKQQPVARDLRIVVTALRMTASLERMGDLAQHIAEVARLRYPATAIPEPMVPTFAEMTDAAARVARRITTLLETHDLELAAEIEADDDTLDNLHAKTFTSVLEPQWYGAPQEVIDVTLVGRYLERFGDHAVSIARRIVYLVTGGATDARRRI
jgi:phosphate transport system protein